jgi:homoserine acetyltransferase
MLIRFVVALTAFAFAGGAFAQLLTERKIFTLPQYTTVGGKTIKDVRIGYESYGKLNAAGDNAIYIAHFLTGDSHAAGRYKADDKMPGYWDSLIGPGKPFDTDRYFVLAADTLVNVNSRYPDATSGPASFDPESGRPWGMRFPIVTMRDFVNVQKALADSLGIKKFAAVAGPSMGSLQVMEWAAAYPDMVERAIPVAPGGFEANPYVSETMDENAFLYLVHAVQLYQVQDVGGIRAKVLAVPARSDLLFHPDYTRKMVATLKAQGTQVEEFEIDGDGGHFDGIFNVARAGDAIRAFLKQ